MAVFGSSRARIPSRGGAGDGGGRPGELRAPRPAAGTATPLKESLEQLYALRPAREVFAEEAIKLIAKASNAKAAALFGYEQRQDRLRLLASIGLDSEATSVLSGDGVRAPWDIPLRGLRNRRINVMEAAQDNPFVPKPLLALSPRQLSVAAIPFYHANLPVGSVVLFSAVARGFPDGLLQVLSQALRVCAVALAALPSSAAVSGVSRAQEELPREQPTLLRGVATLKSELARLTKALEEAERQRAAEAAERVTAESFLQAQRDRVSALEKELTGLREERRRLPTLEEETQHLRDQLRAAQSAAEASQAQVNELKAALADAEQHARESAQAVEALTAARDELHESLVAARDELQRRLDESMSLARDRDAVVAKLQERLRELGARAERAEALETSLAAAEATRAKLEAELIRVGGELAAERTARSGAEATVKQSTQALTASQNEVRNLTAQLTALKERAGELERAQAALREARRQIESLEAARQQLGQELEGVRGAQAQAAQEHEAAAQAWNSRFAALEGERDRLNRELERVHQLSGEATAQLQQRIEALERERQQNAERIAALSDADAERARLQARIAEMEEELAAARESARTLEARVAELSEVSARLIAERRELHARIETLTAGGQTLEQEKQAAINAAQQRVTELESALSRMAKNLDAVRTGGAEELARVRAEAERDASALREEIKTLGQQQEAVRQELERTRQELSSRQSEIASLGGEAERMRGAIERLERERTELTARLEAAGKESGELQEVRRQNELRVAGLEKQIAELSAHRDALGAQLKETREQLTAEAAAQLAEAEAVRKQLEAALAAEREQRDAEVDALNQEMVRVREELSAQLAEMSARHDQANHAFAAERERLTQALQEKELLLQRVEEGLTTSIEVGEGEEIELEGELTIDRSMPSEEEEAAPAVEVEAPAEAAAAAGEPSEVVILDDSELGKEAARHLAELGLAASAIAPNGDLEADIARKRIACAAINLAIPAAWGAVRVLRNGAETAAVPLLAYALAAGSKTGFWFGATDFAVLPLADKNLIQILDRMVPKLRRVIAMSSDIDVMGAVRTQLSGAKVSTAVVLDGRQALDLLPTVRPEAAVLHLSPSCVDVFRAIAGFRSSDISRDIPILFLLDATAQPREESFLSAGVRMLSGRGNLKADDFVKWLGSSVQPYRRG